MQGIINEKLFQIKDNFKLKIKLKNQWQLFNWCNTKRIYIINIYKYLKYNNKNYYLINNV